MNVLLEPGWQAYVVVSVVLFFKMLATSVLKVAVRIRSRTFTVPEDAASFAAPAPRTPEVPSDVALLGRLSLVWTNDLESIPIFLVLALTYVAAGCWTTGALIYFPLFAFARIAHTVAYLRCMQPARTIAYLAGVLACLAIALHLLAGIFVMRRAFFVT
jgi:uncharacterized MAPEG superfamily protein